jgi:hypothetical protein
MMIVFLVAAIVTAACAVSVALDVRSIRGELLTDIRKLLLTAERTHPVQGHPGRQLPLGIHNHRTMGAGAGSFAFWVWRDGEWALETDSVPTDFHPGLPPAYPGAFNGDKIKTWVAGR